MSIMIRKGDKYYSLQLWKTGDATHGVPILWLSTEQGEGMEVNAENMEKLYDAIDKFFQENM